MVFKSKTFEVAIRIHIFHTKFKMKWNKYARKIKEYSLATVYHHSKEKTAIAMCKKENQILKFNHGKLPKFHVDSKKLSQNVLGNHTHTHTHSFTHSQTHT